ncbi:MAG: ABC transporter permease [Gemmatimonadaceae bacterium]|nr:ABC transporter permease [Gemmatimonadaceae bacterium]
MILFSFRNAWRSLRAAPAFSALVALTMAVAIALSALVLGTVNAVLRPASVARRAELLYRVQATVSGKQSATPSAIDLRQMRASVPSLEVISTVRGDYAAVVSRGEAEQRHVMYVDEDFFEVLETRPSAGRFFLPTDRAFGEAPLAVVSDRFWRERLHGASDLSAGTIEVDGTTFRVVGVAPPGLERMLGADLWLLSMRGAVQSTSGLMPPEFVARLRPRASQATLERDLRAMGLHVAAQAPSATAPRFHVRALAVALAEFSELQRSLAWSTRAIVLIACANLANLALARALSRESAHAIARAIGATRGRIVMDILAECAILSVVGGAIGTLCVFALQGALRTAIPTDVPYIGRLDLRLDWMVVTGAIVVSILAACLFGIFPALRASASDPSISLARAAVERTGGSRRLYTGIIVAQLATSLAMLVSAGLLARASGRLSTVGLGFERRGLYEARVLLPAAYRTDSGSANKSFMAAESAVRATPGVVDVSWWVQPRVVGLSVMGFGSGGSTHVLYNPELLTVGAGFLGTMRTRISRGRDLQVGDDEGPAKVVVDERVARELWPDEDALGRQLAVLGPNGMRSYATVIGVSSRMRRMFSSFDVFDVAPGAVYLSRDPTGTTRHLVIRVDESTAASAVARLANRLRDALPPGTQVGIERADRAQRRLEDAHRFITMLFVALAVCAVSLCMLGIYSVLAYATVTRRRELAIRLAVGGTPVDLMRLVSRDATVLALAGTAFGGLLSLGVARLIDPFLLDLYHVNAWTLGAAECVLLAATVLAAFIPVRRAMATDPASMLRAP